MYFRHVLHSRRALRFKLIGAQSGVVKRFPITHCDDRGHKPHVVHIPQAGVEDYGTSGVIFKTFNSSGAKVTGTPPASVSASACTVFSSALKRFEKR
jgi:hypothetical protein